MERTRIEGTTRKSVVTTAIAVAVLTSVVAYHGRVLGSLAIDDAFISYRYAANLAHGEGLVFNVGERVQGFTNPLHTILLALGGRIGLDIEDGGFLIGLAGALLTALGIFFSVPSVAGRVAGFLASIGLLFTPAFVMNALSGMETMLFCALMVWTWIAFTRGHPITTGVLLGLLVMTRPDGAFIAIALGLHWLLFDRRTLVRVIVPAALLYGVWLAFAWATYGTPLPQSIVAKRLIHEAPIDLVTRAYLRFLDRTLAQRVLWIFSLIAIVIALLRRQRAAWIGLGALTYLAGLCSSGVLPIEVPKYFLWYAIPLFPCAFLLVVRLASSLANVGGRKWGFALASILALIPAILAGFDHLMMRRVDLEKIQTHFKMREQVYAETARVIRERAGPRVNDILVGEVGVLGYHLLGHRVHDSSGINSRKIYEARLQDRRELEAKGPVPPPLLWEGSPNWVLRFLDDVRPDFVTTLERYLRMGMVRNDPTFQANYEPIEQERVWKAGNMLFSRRGESR